MHIFIYGTETQQTNEAFEVCIIFERQKNTMNRVIC